MAAAVRISGRAVLSKLGRTLANRSSLFPAWSWTSWLGLIPRPRRVFPHPAGLLDVRRPSCARRARRAWVERPDFEAVRRDCLDTGPVGTVPGPRGEPGGSRICLSIPLDQARL